MLIFLPGILRDHISVQHESRELQKHLNKKVRVIEIPIAWIPCVSFWFEKWFRSTCVNPGILVQFLKMSIAFSTDEKPYCRKTRMISLANFGNSNTWLCRLSWPFGEVADDVFLAFRRASIDRFARPISWTKSSAFLIVYACEGSWIVVTHGATLWVFNSSNHDAI